MRLEDVHPDSRTQIQEVIDLEGVQCVQVSCHSEEGVMDLKNKACDALLAHRVDNKMKGTKVNSIINRIHVAQPKPRDDIARPPFIPDAIKQKKNYDNEDPGKRKLLKDRELEEGGPGVYNINLRGGSNSCTISSLPCNLKYIPQKTIFLPILVGKWIPYLRL